MNLPFLRIGLPVLLSLLLLGGCELSAPREPVVFGVQPADWANTAARLRGFDHWTIEGKISVRRDDRIDTGQIRSWTQDEAAYDIELASVILGLGATRVRGDDATVTIHQAGEEPVTLLQDPERAFFSAFGWPLPVRQISSWIKGLPAAVSDGSAPEITFGAGGEVIGIEQDGWSVSLRKHQPVDIGSYQPLLLPHFVQLSRLPIPGQDAQVTIKMAISNWTPFR
ncbi:lipoprotein insertase outer membrane protein LolB [Allohahella marinimesophila]|uniref:Outer-membrane lipoprotein LolB n=1 Tax=Allohahella marinimesophila TaxID=1054972 RepID=A0ABP7Q3Q6_9GAMM